MLISEERLFPCVMGQLFGLDEDEVVERIQDPIVFLLGFQALSEYVHFQSRYLYSNTSMSCSRCLQFQYHLRDLAVRLTLLQFEQSLLGPSAQS